MRDLLELDTVKILQEFFDDLKILLYYFFLCFIISLYLANYKFRVGLDDKGLGFEDSCKT